MRNLFYDNWQEISPLTSGRLSHSSGPLNACLTEETSDGQPASPSDQYDDVVKVCLDLSVCVQCIFAILVQVDFTLV